MASRMLKELAGKRSGFNGISMEWCCVKFLKIYLMIL
jgi:hypothetical protein